MQTESTGKKTVRQQIKAIWTEWIKPLLIVVVILTTFRSAVADWNDVPTGSMEPTILVGDRVLVNKMAYGLRVPFTKKWIAHWDEPDHGEIVICYSPADGKRLVKRLIGVPGDRIELRKNILFINDEPTEYGTLDQQIIDGIETGEQTQYRFMSETIDQRSHAIMLTPRIRAKRSFGPVTLPDNQFLILGDNRDQSHDSRFFGTVDRNQIVGRVGRLAFSLDHDHWYKPRWNRFFHSLK